MKSLNNSTRLSPALVSQRIATSTFTTFPSSLLVNVLLVFFIYLFMYLICAIFNGASSVFSDISCIWVRAFVVCVRVWRMGCCSGDFLTVACGPTEKEWKEKKRYKLTKSLSSNRCWREGRKKERKEREEKRPCISPGWWVPLSAGNLCDGSPFFSNITGTLFFFFFYSGRSSLPFFLNSRRPALFFHPGPCYLFYLMRRLFFFFFSPPHNYPHTNGGLLLLPLRLSERVTQLNKL